MKYYFKKKFFLSVNKMEQQIFYPTSEELKNVISYISKIEKQYHLHRIGAAKLVLPKNYTLRSGYNCEDFEFKTIKTITQNFQKIKLDKDVYTTFATKGRMNLSSYYKKSMSKKYAPPKTENIR